MELDVLLDENIKHNIDELEKTIPKFGFKIDISIIKNSSLKDQEKRSQLQNLFENTFFPIFSEIIQDLNIYILSPDFNDYARSSSLFQLCLDGFKQVESLTSTFEGNEHEFDEFIKGYRNIIKNMSQIANLLLLTIEILEKRYKYKSIIHCEQYINQIINAINQIISAIEYKKFDIEKGRNYFDDFLTPLLLLWYNLNLVWYDHVFYAQEISSQIAIRNTKEKLINQKMVSGINEVILKVLKCKSEFLINKHLKVQLHHTSVIDDNHVYLIDKQFEGSGKLIDLATHQYSPQLKLVSIDDEIHSFNKIHKECRTLKDNNDYTQLMKLYDSTKEQATSIEDSSDVYLKFSYQFLVKYIHNVAFSILVENYKNGTTTDFSLLQEHYTQSTTLHKEHNLKNYYPHRKYLQVLLDAYLPNIKEKKEVNIYTKNMELSLTLFESHMAWCKRFGLDSFYSPIQESIYTCFPNESALPARYKNKDIKLCIITNDSAPIDYSKEYRIFHKIKQQMSLLDTILEYKDLKYQYDQQVKKINKLKNNIKNKDRDSMQILGVFAAFITFSFGSINIFRGMFDKENTVPQGFSLIKLSFTFLSAFGLSLVFFVMLLRLVFYSSHELSNNEKTTNWIFIVIVFLSFIIVSVGSFL